MEYVQPWREKRRRRWLSRRGARRQNRFWKGKVACTCQQRGFTYTQYAHDSRQKRVGGKTAAAPNKGCSTPRTLGTADRTNAPVRRARSYSNTPTCRARAYTCNANELAEKPANIHVHARPGWCLFFSAHEYLFPIHVWALEGKFASRFGVTCVHTYICIYIYTCVRVRGTCTAFSVTRACACHARVYDASAPWMAPDDDNFADFSRCLSRKQRTRLAGLRGGCTPLSLYISTGYSVW